jgi:hypothetical protein
MVTSDPEVSSVNVSTQTRNLPVLEMAFPFPVMAPISSTVLLRIPLLEIFHLVRYPHWQSAIVTGTGRDLFVPFPVLGVPFPVLGYAISGTVIHWAPYRNWTLCAWSHFRYQALPVPVCSFLGSHTGTGIYVRGFRERVASLSLSQFVTNMRPSQKQKKRTVNAVDTGNVISHFRYWYHYHPNLGITTRATLGNNKYVTRRVA